VTNKHFSNAHVDIHYLAWFICTEPSCRASNRLHSYCNKVINKST